MGVNPPAVPGPRHYYETEGKGGMGGGDGTAGRDCGWVMTRQVSALPVPACQAGIVGG